MAPFLGGFLTPMLVLSADTLVRFRNGRILVHTTSSQLPAFESNHPMLVGWLCRFAAPTDPDAAIAALLPTERKDASNVIDYLKRSGVLVPVGSPESRERSAADAALLARNHLRQLARSAYELACDVLGLGPEASEAALAERTGVGLERRLLAALASLDALRNELLPVRRVRVSEILHAPDGGPDHCARRRGDLVLLWQDRFGGNGHPIRSLPGIYGVRSEQE